MALRLGRQVRVSRPSAQNFRRAILVAHELRWLGYPVHKGDPRRFVL
jgi:hypothetical protein